MKKYEQKSVISELLNENERLKREYDILDGIIDLNNAKIGQLEKENKELREKLQTNYNDDIKKSDEIFLLACKKNAYLQALQEIREMAKRGFAICDDDCGNAIRYTQILNIINKAEEE